MQVYKDPSKLNNKKTNNLIKKLKGFEHISPKKIHRWQQRESCSTSLVIQFSSVQFSCSVVSNFLRPHESQHARPPCPSPTPRVYSNSCPSSQWCHPAFSSSVVPFSSCPQSLPASESFPMSQFFAWGGQSTGVSSWFVYFLFSPCLLSHIFPAKKNNNCD